jgi:hypothetical protein
VVRGLREWHVGDGSDNGHKPAASYAPAGKIPGITCVVLEGPMLSYASLWQGGRHTWEIRHNRSYGVRHLEASGDLPSEFASFRDIAIDKLGADYMFAVPLDTAATITGYRYGRWVEDDFFRNLQTLLPTSQPPKL